jgi:hypothetical protein
LFSTAVGVAGLVLIAASGTLWFRAAAGVRLPKSRSAYVAVWLGGVALGVIALASGVGWIGGLAAGLSILGGSFLALTVAISRQRAGSGAVSVGAKLPDFSALDENGDSFELASVMGRPLLLKFFRGHW